MQSPKGHAPIQDVVKAALEVATRTSATEKKKPLPAVDARDKLAHPVKSTEKEECGSYDIISDETIMEARDTNEKQTESEAYTLNGSAEEANGQDDAKPPEQVGNAQLELEN